MLARTLFNCGNLIEHYHPDRLQASWSALVTKRPQYFRAVWSATQSCFCQQMALQKSWNLDTLHLNLRDGLLTFHWALGEKLTTELLAIGQNPMLRSLMTLKETLIEEANLVDHFDLQTLLLLLVTQEIAQAQTFVPSTVYLQELLEDLHLEDEFYAQVETIAIRIDLLGKRYKVGAA